MGKLTNSIVIAAPIATVWSALTDLELLSVTDPAVEKAVLLTEQRTGINAQRKVHMKDGKNWFDEKITVFQVNQHLTYELTACSFPIQSLKHNYSFQTEGSSIRVIQVMEYQVKFGWLGKLLDRILLAKQFNSGIQQFMIGLKTYAEKA